MTKAPVDKYANAKTGAGKRIMSRAYGERLGGKYWRGLGHLANAGAAVTAMTGNAPGAAALLSAGSASYITGHKASRKAENLRLKSRAVDSLVNKSRTGNTLGAKGLSTGDAAKFAAASHSFHTAAANTATNTATGGDTFERTRHDARSGKPITETVRKRGTGSP